MHDALVRLLAPMCGPRELSAAFIQVTVPCVTPRGRRTSAAARGRCAASRSLDDSPAVDRVCSQYHGRGSLYRRITSNSANLPRALKQARRLTTLTACSVCRRTSRKKT